ncbi:hypothetical protein BJ508DRAFT_201824, partial [Ascobolus immersus RN42]
PQWPSFSLSPTHPYTLTPDIMLPAQLILIPSLFPPSLCKTYIHFLSQLHLTTTPSIPQKGMAARVNDRFEVQDEAFAWRLWNETGLGELVGAGGRLEPEMRAKGDGEAVGCSPRIRVYRYQKGHYFDRHYDDDNLITLHMPNPVDEPDADKRKATKCRTTWTLLVYLSGQEDGVKGGETVFYTDESGGKKDEMEEDKIVVPLLRGAALLHKHGRDCLLHEGAEVLDGVKWVLRSD